MGYAFVKKIMDRQEVELRQTNYASSKTFIYHMTTPNNELNSCI